MAVTCINGLAEDLPPLIVEDTTGDGGINQPLQFGLPLPPGFLKDAARLAIDDGGPRRAQFDTLSRYPDGSIRWVLVQFMTTLKAGERKQVGLALDTVDTVPASPLRVIEKRDMIRIDTGRLSFDLPRKGFTLPRRLRLDGTGSGLNDLRLGFKIVNLERREFMTGLDSETVVTVVEAGPVRALIHYKGKHTSARGERWLDYDVWLSVYAGSPRLSLKYRITNAETGMTDPESATRAQVARIREMSLKVDAPGFNARQMLGGDDNGPGAHMQVMNSASLDQFTYESFDVRGPGAVYPRGKQAMGWATVASTNRSIAVFIDDFALNFPKALRIRDASIAAELYPGPAHPLALRVGAAKTHSLHLWIENKPAPIDLIRQSRALRQPPTVILPANWYRKTGVLGMFLASPTDRYPVLEAKLDKAFRWAPADGLRGLLQFGDFGSSQHVLNNAHDLTHSMFVLFARTGRHDYLRTAANLAQHAMDQDFLHASHTPGAAGAMLQHGNPEAKPAWNAGGTWIQGLLDRYHFLGDREALRIARATGDYLARSLPGNRTAIRTESTLGTPLQAFCGLYQVTGDPAYLVAARRTVDLAVAWQNPDTGEWSHPIAGQAVYQSGIGIPAASLLVGLARYHAISGDQTTRDTFLKGMQWLLGQRYPDGSFFWMTNPRMRMPTRSPLLLPPFAHAYAMTGDRSYLDAALTPFKLAAQPTRAGPNAIQSSIYLGGIWEILDQLHQSGMLRDINEWHEM